MRFLLFIIIGFILLSCNKEIEKLELFSEEAFAFRLDESWELNSSIRLKGFVQNEVEDLYKINISYYADLIQENGDSIARVDEGEIMLENEEELSDVEIEVQIELDSTFSAGKYKLRYYVTDENSLREISKSVSFELTTD